MVFGGILGGSLDAIAGRSPGRKAGNVRLNAGGIFAQSKVKKSGKSKITVGSTPERQALIAQQAGLFSGLADRFAELGEEVRPGFGRLTEARVASLDAARRRAVGDIRENLSRRRVLGSSFGEGQISRTQEEFGRAEAEVRAQSFLEELDLTTQFIEKETQFDLQAVQTSIDELNLQLSVAQQLAGITLPVVSANSLLQQQLAFDAAEALASGIGQGFGAAAGGGGGAGK